MSELEVQSYEVEHFQKFRDALETARKRYDEAEQDYRLFVINRAYRENWKPWEICGHTDGEDDAKVPAVQCQLPKGHAGRWHQEWSKDGRLLGEWS